MTLNEYFAGQPHGAKAAMAKDLEISKTWLSQIIAGKKKPSPALTIAISKMTKNKVSKKVLRADVFDV